MFLTEKRFTALVLLVLTLVTLTFPKPSHGMVALTAAEPAIIVGGLAAGVVGVGAIVLGYKISKSESILKKIGGITLGILGTWTSGVGLIFLKDETSMGLEFLRLSNDEAGAIGLSKAELSSYNQELDQVNYLIQEVDARLNLIDSPSVNDSTEAWQGVQEYLSPMTFSALQKISINALAQE